MSRVREHPFAVALPEGLPIAGVVLADQIKNPDSMARRAEIAAVVPPAVVAETLAKLATLLT